LRSTLVTKHGIGNALFVAPKTLPHAKDVSFTHMLCAFNHLTQKHEIVGVMYPSSSLESLAMQEYLTMLEVAAVCNDDTLFYQRCKERGLNMDLIHRWMASNNIANAADAKNLIADLTTSTKSALIVSNQPALKLAA